MRTVLRIFFKSEGASPWITVLCLLSASFAEGIGLATLLPLLTVAMDADSSSPFVSLVRGFFQEFGVSLAVGPLLIIVVSALLLKSTLTWMANCYTGYAVAEVTTRFRGKLSRLFMDSQWEWYVRQPAGRLNHTVLGLTSAAGSSYAFAASFVAQTVETIILIGVALVVSWKLAIVGAISGIAIAALLDWFVRRSRRAGRKEIIRQRKLMVVWGVTISNFKVLKGMARQHAFLRMFESRLADWRKAARQQVFNREGRSGVQDILFALLVGTGLYIALVVWRIPLVELIVMFAIINRAVRGTGKLQAHYQKAVAGEYAFIELQTVMEEIREAAEPNPGARPASLNARCQFERVTFSYGKVPVLDQVDLEIPVGEITVLTGGSGAGKTTIADLLLGMHRPVEGQITVDGVPLDQIDLQSWRRLIGYVAQDSTLFHDTILTNIQLGDSSITVEQVEEALRLAQAWDFISKRPNGIYSYAGEAGLRLSGGQRQRLSLARAIVRHPRLLILDEVTSALDPSNEALICQSVRRLASGMAVLAITHRPAFLEIADRVYEVADGKIRLIQPKPLHPSRNGRSLQSIDLGAAE